MIARFWFYFYSNYVFGWLLCINGYYFTGVGGWWEVLGVGTILCGLSMFYDASLWYRAIQIIKETQLNESFHD